MIPLEQLPPLQRIIFRCEEDGLIDDKEIIAINGEFCCPFCSNPVEIEFEDIYVQQQELLIKEVSFDKSCQAPP